jgi:hypothetical protein
LSPGGHRFGEINMFLRFVSGANSMEDVARDQVILLRDQMSDRKNSAATPTKDSQVHARAVGVGS